jgi:hypothetical protein
MDPIEGFVLRVEECKIGNEQLAWRGGLLRT